MYIFTTLGNAHKNVWEDNNSFALFDSKYEKNYIYKIKDDLKLNKKVFAIGRYAPYYGKNRSQQGEPAQYNHSSLLLKDVMYISNPRYDTKITFELLRKISPNETKKIFDIKPQSIPLIEYIDDKLLSTYLNLGISI